MDTTYSFTVTKEGEVIFTKDEEKAIKNIPTMQMINKSIDEITNNAEKLIEKLKNDLYKVCQLSIEDCESQIGGGSLPIERIKSKCITIKP